MRGAPLTAVDPDGNVRPFPESTGRQRFLSYSELRKCPMPEPIVEGVFNRNEETVIFGPQGSCKTAITLDMILHCIYGMDWHGRKTTMGRFIYVCGEGGGKALANRIEAWLQYHGITNTDTLDECLLVTEYPVHMLDTESVDELLALAEGIKHLQAIVVDTLGANFGGGDENSVRDMSVFLDAIRLKSRQRDRRPTDEELQRLFDLWDSNPRQSIPMTTICKFAIATGMRQSEITRIRWDDMDEKKKTVTIRDRKDPQEKDGNDQEVPLLDATGYDAFAIVMAQPRGGRIFPYDHNSISAAFTRGCKKLKIEDLRFHDLRHEACSRLFEAGYEIQQVALVSGHRDWKMLQRYTQLRAEDLHR